MDRANIGLLQYAAEHGLLNPVQRFVVGGMEVDQQDRYGVFPLHRAVRGTFIVHNGGAGVGVIPGQHLDVVNFLLRAGPIFKINMDRSRSTIVQRLQTVAKSTIVDLDGRTPVETVALYHTPALIKPKRFAHSIREVCLERL